MILSKKSHFVTKWNEVLRIPFYNANILPFHSINRLRDNANCLSPSFTGTPLLSRNSSRLHSPPPILHAVNPAWSATGSRSRSSGSRASRICTSASVPPGAWLSLRSRLRRLGSTVAIRVFSVCGELSAAKLFAAFSTCSGAGSKSIASRVKNSRWKSASSAA